jgi:hypothetical protein
MNRRNQEHEQNDRYAQRTSRGPRNDWTHDDYRSAARPRGESYDSGAEEPGWRQPRYETSRYVEDRPFDERGDERYERGFAQPQREYRTSSQHDYGIRNEQDWDARRESYDYGRYAGAREFGDEERGYGGHPRGGEAARDYSRPGSRREIEPAQRRAGGFTPGRRYGSEPGYGDRYGGEFGTAADAVRRYDYSEGDDYRVERPAGGSRAYASPTYGVPQGQLVRGGFAGRGPKGYTRSDERLKEDISERLTDDPYVDASDVSVEVRGGKVTLTGQVDQRWTKHHVEDLVDRCSGVQEIENRLTVSRSRAGGELESQGVRGGGAATPRSTTVSDASTKKQ